MFIYPKDIKRVDSKQAKELFEEYEVSDKDMERYNKLIESDKIEKAMTEFYEKYILGSINEYNKQVMGYFEAGTSGEIDKSNKTLLYSSIISISSAFKERIKSSISFIYKAISKKVFKDEGITRPDIKNEILETTLNRFNQLIEGAMSETAASILQPIRDAQRMFISANQSIATNKIKGEDLDRYEVEFKKRIKKEIPQIEEFAQKGLLLNRAGKRYQFDQYFDMATSTTALNIQRHAVEYMAEVEQEEILEYLQIDDRTIKTKPREICKSVLSKKSKGKSYVALTQSAAEKLGIKLLSSVREKGGLGPYCRHGLKRLAKSLHEELLNA